MYGCTGTRSRSGRRSRRSARSPGRAAAGRSPARRRRRRSRAARRRRCARRPLVPTATASAGGREREVGDRDRCAPAAAVVVAAAGWTTTLRGALPTAMVDVGPLARSTTRDVVRAFVGDAHGLAVGAGAIQCGCLPTGDRAQRRLGRRVEQHAARPGPGRRPCRRRRRENHLREVRRRAGRDLARRCLSVAGSSTCTALTPAMREVQRACRRGRTRGRAAACRARCVRATVRAGEVDHDERELARLLRGDVGDACRRAGSRSCAAWRPARVRDDGAAWRCRRRRRGRRRRRRPGSSCRRAVMRDPVRRARRPRSCARRVSRRGVDHAHCRRSVAG